MRFLKKLQAQFSNVTEVLRDLENDEDGYEKARRLLSL